MTRLEELRMKLAKKGKLARLSDLNSFSEDNKKVFLNALLFHLRKWATRPGVVFMGERPKEWKFKPVDYTLIEVGFHPVKGVKYIHLDLDKSEVQILSVSKTVLSREKFTGRVQAYPVTKIKDLGSSLAGRAYQLLADLRREWQEANRPPEKPPEPVAPKAPPSRPPVEDKKPIPNVSDSTRNPDIRDLATALNHAGVEGKLRMQMGDTLVMDYAWGDKGDDIGLRGQIHMFPTPPYGNNEKWSISISQGYWLRAENQALLSAEEEGKVNQSLPTLNAKLKDLVGQILSFLRSALETRTRVRKEQAEKAREEETWSVAREDMDGYVTDIEVYSSKEKAIAAAKEAGGAYVVRGTQMWNKSLGRVEEHDRSAWVRYYH